MVAYDAEKRDQPSRIGREWGAWGSESKKKESAMSYRREKKKGRRS